MDNMINLAIPIRYVCVSAHLLHIICYKISMNAVLTQKVKALTSNIKTTYSPCDLGPSQQPLLTSLM